MERSSVFIGSSSKALDVARAVREQLQGDDLQITIWNEDDIFSQGEATLESLFKALERYDFAILVWTPDDLIVSQSKLFSPRDNVLFETGLFMGHLGRFRTFIVLDLKQKIKIPTDLSGITFAVYRRSSDQDEISMSDLGPACDKIRRRIKEIGRLNRGSKEKELGSLYRLLNACTYPLYPDVQNELLLNYVNYRQLETFHSISEIVDFIEDLLRDYLHPLLQSKELQSLRIYFAYYLGDGVQLAGLEKTPTYCIDQDRQGRVFSGQFVIGISNTEGFAEQSWRVGRAISGYEKGRNTSNCATVFAGGSAKYKRDLSKYGTRVTNYDTEGELSVYSVPVKWYTYEGNATIGVLAVSSRYPNFISDYIRSRIDLLGNIIGFLFSLYAAEKLETIDAEVTPNPLSPSQLIGFDIHKGVSGETFAQRVIALRQQIAAHFEEDFLNQGIHVWDGNELKVAVLESTSS